MPKIIMIEDDKGAEDGVFVKTFKKGEEYNVNDSLFKAFTVFRKTALAVKEVEKAEKEANIKIEKAVETVNIENKVEKPQSTKSKTTTRKRRTTKKDK